MTTMRTAARTPIVALALAALAACTPAPEPMPVPTATPVEVEEAPQPAPVEAAPDCASLLEQYEAEFAAFYAEGGALALGPDVTNDAIAAAQDRHVEMGSSLLEHDCYLEFEEYGKFAIGLAGERSAERLREQG